jgi:Cu(I)/Ag(I) efflux system membrane protein CusA/SilA
VQSHRQVVPCPARGVGCVGTRSVFAEQAVSGYYLDVEINRPAAARYGISVQDVQDVLASAVGGMTITQTVEGRQRYAVRLRYPQELRDQPEKLAEVLIPASQRAAATSPRGMAGMASTASSALAPVQIPLGQIARVRNVPGPMVVRTEGAFPTAWVYVDVQDRDVAGYVRDAQQMVQRIVTLPGGYTLQWSRQYEYMQRASRSCC